MDVTFSHAVAIALVTTNAYLFLVIYQQTILDILNQLEPLDTATNNSINWRRFGYSMLLLIVTASIMIASLSWLGKLGDFLRGTGLLASSSTTTRNTIRDEDDDNGDTIHIAIESSPRKREEENEAQKKKKLKTKKKQRTLVYV